MSAPSSANNSCDVSPRSEWSAILRETVIEVFATMAGIAVTAPESGGIPVLAQVTGMVGIAGTLSATFTLQCSLHAATKIASQMLKVPEAEAEALQKDAIGEICNIVAGYFKAKIGLGGACMLSLPTVLAGTDYKVSSRRESLRMEQPLLYESEPMSIVLDIRP